MVPHIPAIMSVWVSQSEWISRGEVPSYPSNGINFHFPWVTGISLIFQRHWFEFCPGSDGDSLYLNNGPRLEFPYVTRFPQIIVTLFWGLPVS